MSPRARLQNTGSSSIEYRRRNLPMARKAGEPTPVVLSRKLWATLPSLAGDSSTRTTGPSEVARMRRHANSTVGKSRTSTMTPKKRSSNSSQNVRGDFMCGTRPNTIIRLHCVQAVVAWVFTRSSCAGLAEHQSPQRHSELPPRLHRIALVCG